MVVATRVVRSQPSVAPTSYAGHARTRAAKNDQPAMGGLLGILHRGRHRRILLDAIGVARRRIGVLGIIWPFSRLRWTPRPGRIFVPGWKVVGQRVARDIVHRPRCE